MLAAGVEGFDGLLMVVQVAVVVVVVEGYVAVVGFVI